MTLPAPPFSTTAVPVPLPPMEPLNVSVPAWLVRLRPAPLPLVSMATLSRLSVPATPAPAMAALLAALRVRPSTCGRPSTVTPATSVSALPAVFSTTGGVPAGR